MPPNILNIAWKRGLSVLVFVCLTASSAAMAQKSIRDSSITMALVDVNYLGSSPGGDLSERFGWTNQMGASIGIKHKSNFYASIGANFLWGETVKEEPGINQMGYDYLYDLGDTAFVREIGFIDGNGNAERPAVFQRGFSVPIRVGKIFPKLSLTKKENENSGPFVEVGVQFIQHQLKYEFKSEELTWANDDFLKGYDRLTNGIGVLQSVGYRYFGSNRYVNVFVAFDISQNFTRSRRSLNYDTNTVDTQQRMDILTGVRVGWSLPLYKVASSSQYYYY